MERRDSAPNTSNVVIWSNSHSGYLHGGKGVAYFGGILSAGELPGYLQCLSESGITRAPQIQQQIPVAEVSRHFETWTWNTL